jgi:3-deoxy-D-manno-octulosonic-acid transferase
VQHETLWLDASRLPHIHPEQFTPPPAHSAQGVLATGSGRGQAHRVNIAGNQAVLRHYRRGGLIARFSEDQYWQKPAGHSRAMREFALLRFMRSWGLPVPVPLAARHNPSGWFYRADILVELIPDSENVAQCLSQRPLEPIEWQTLGQAIRQLHDRQIFHADLNCHNLLLDAKGLAWVVDFDRCEIRPGTQWKDANLARLQRSLRKEKGKRPVFHWDDAEWVHLTHGYHTI